MAHHTFEPKIFHNTLGPHEPVLKISSGDTVSTTTLDAGGNNALNLRIAQGPNPLTGPFFIEGAMPSDTLAITFDKLRPNRKTGFTRNTIAPNVLDPGFSVKNAANPEIIEWAINKEKDIVEPLDMDALSSKISFPLKPMLGCFGLAPSVGQAISTATSGNYGGNMDYNGFIEGVTVYLPVSMPGALFFLGDGHALQGDGEIVGTGIETSFDVTFTVEVLKEKTIKWPRAEDKTHIFTVGNARPLDQCVQHATSEMVKWLDNDLGLDSRVTHLLMGQTVEYDLGNIFDPAYTMVCKIQKKWLKELVDKETFL